MKYLTNNQLFSQVYLFFQNSFSELGAKQFHFASRLYLWNGDSFYKEKLDQFKPKFLEPNFLHRPYTNRQLAYKKFTPERLRALERFPGLLEMHDLLLQGLYAKTVYGVTYDSEVHDLVSKEHALNLIEQLLLDQRSFALLSTYAVTLLYLVKRYLLPESDIDLDLLVQIAENALDAQEFAQLSFLIYFYTHAIIGETLFYSRPIPKDVFSTYLFLLKKVETLLTSNFQKCSLDHKLEFLMCCRLCSYDAKLETAIYDEIKQSISPQGMYLVDTPECLSGNKW